MQSRSAARRFFIGLLGAMLLAATIIQPTIAAPKARDWAALDAQVSRLQANGASQKAIDALLARNGLVEVDAGLGELDPVAFGSTSNDITLAQPKVYEDTRFDYFVAMGSWQWKHTCTNVLSYKNSCIGKDCGAMNEDCGGPDGFGIVWNRAVNEVKTSFYTHDTDGYQTTWSYPEDINEFGASWVTQDHFDVNRYNWDGGNIYYMFHLAGCTRGQAFKLKTRISHTWSNTSVTSFGVFAYGFDIGWNVAQNHWDVTNPGPTYWYPCGQ